MIHYPTSEDRLRELVNSHFPTTLNNNNEPRKNGRKSWFIRAAEENAHLSTAGAFIHEDQAEIWKELKPIFTKIQGSGKCGYCESKLARRRSGGADGDVEHYRPKDKVIDWDTSNPIPTGGTAPGHYYWLAYVIRNYLLACRVCNQDYKRNFFPISGGRCHEGNSDPAELRAELPYLLHPLDPDDPDPEELIEFFGVTPRPKVGKDHPDYWRAASCRRAFPFDGVS